MGVIGLVWSPFGERARKGCVYDLLDDGGGTQKKRPRYNTNITETRRERKKKLIPFGFFPRPFTRYHAPAQGQSR